MHASTGFMMLEHHTTMNFISDELVAGPSLDILKLVGYSLYKGSSEDSWPWCSLSADPNE